MPDRWRLGSQPSGSTALFGDVQRWAEISGDGLHRYALGRQWDDTEPLLGWVMLNPSTADSEQDDPTIRRCVGFAKAWGYGGILVGNVYAYRATDPRELNEAAGAGIDIRGSENERHLREIGRTAPMVVCAWGAKAWGDHARAVQRLLASTGTGVACLGRTKAGAPRHPLYVAASTPWETYS